MSKVLYCKSSNERDRRFALHTILTEEDDGRRVIRKIPDTKEAEQHVQRIALCGEKLRELYDEGQLQINRCKSDGSGVMLEYLEGATLEQEIDRTFSAEGTEGAETLIRRFFAVMQPERKLQPFSETDEFRGIFGQHPELEGLPALPAADIDMIFPNVICNSGGWHLIDYEWTFFFPVPAEFLRFRTLHYYLETSTRREWLREKGLERWGIDSRRIPLWETMEQAFQTYILGDYIPLQELYVQMSPGMTDLRALDELDSRFKKDAIRIYWSRNDDLSEEQTLVFPLSEGWNTLSFRLPEGTRKVRLDPGERSAVCSLRKWLADGKKPVITAHNGVQISDQVWVFPGEDPQWTALSGRGTMSVMDIEIKVQQMDADLLESYIPKTGKGKPRRRFF